MATLRRIADSWRGGRSLTKPPAQTRGATTAPSSSSSSSASGSDKRGQKRGRLEQDVIQNLVDANLTDDEAEMSQGHEASSTPYVPLHEERMAIRSTNGTAALDTLRQFSAVPPRSLVLEEAPPVTRGLFDIQLPEQDASSRHSSEEEEEEEEPAGELPLPAGAAEQRQLHFPAEPGGPVGREEAGKALYRYQPLEHNDALSDSEIDEEEEDRYIARNNKPWCFACEMREDPRNLDGHPALRKLENVRLDNYGKVATRVVARMMQEVYNQELRPKIMPPSDRRAWKRKTIVEHLEVHAPDKFTDTVANLRVARGVVRLLSNSVRLCNVEDPSDSKVDIGHVRLLAQMMKVTQQLSSEADAYATEQQKRM